MSTSRVRLKALQSVCTALLFFPVVGVAGGPQFTDWSAPVILGPPVNAATSDDSPELTRDGLSLYFTSTNRPGGFGGADIWVSRRACLSCDWETPVAVGPNINTSGTESSPSISRNGHLMFFMSDRDGSIGDTDIWMARRKDKHDDFGWGPPVNLGPLVNTTSHETSPEFLGGRGKKEGHILFFVREVSDAQSIFEANLTRKGEPKAPATPVAGLGEPVGLDGGPALRYDGRELIFFSDRPGGVGVAGTLDIWSATRSEKLDPWDPPQNLGEPVNFRLADLTPSLSHDGTILIFAAGVQRGGLGLRDLWISTRERLNEDDDDTDKD